MDASAGTPHSNEDEQARKDIRRAQLAAKALLQETNGILAQTFAAAGKDDWNLDLAALRTMGKRGFDVMYADDPSRDEGEAMRLAFAYASEKGDALMAAGLLLPSSQLRYGWAARWYEQGTPRVVWSDQKFPEVLMATTADASVAELLRAPWRAFLVDLPPGLLHSKHPETGESCELTQLLVHCVTREHDGARTWNFLAQGPGYIELWRHGLTSEHLLKVGRDYYSDLYAGSVDKQDERVLVLLGRLLIGLCLTFSDPEKVRLAKHTKASKQGGGMGKRRPEPVTRNYVVEAVTTLKVREALIDFVKNGQRKAKGSVNLRSLVRGHWKMQAHGAGHLLRKLIFVEPYWSPRDDSLPAVTREFVVQSPPCSTSPTPASPSATGHEPVNI